MAQALFALNSGRGPGAQAAAKRNYTAGEARDRAMSKLGLNQTSTGWRITAIVYP